MGTSGAVDGTSYLEKQAASARGTATKTARRKPNIFVFITAVVFRRQQSFSLEFSIKDNYTTQKEHTSGKIVI
jgi:hypothetical protein